MVTYLIQPLRRHTSSRPQQRWVLRSGYVSFNAVAGLVPVYRHNTTGIFCRPFLVPGQTFCSFVWYLSPSQSHFPLYFSCTTVIIRLAVSRPFLHCINLCLAAVCISSICNTNAPHVWPAALAVPPRVAPQPKKDCSKVTPKQ